MAKRNDILDEATVVERAAALSDRLSLTFQRLLRRAGLQPGQLEPAVARAERHPVASKHLYAARRQLDGMLPDTSPRPVNPVALPRGLRA